MSRTSPASPEPALRKRRFLLGFAILSVLGGISFGLARMITALYAIELGATTTELGLIAGAQSLGLLVMAIPIGILVEHYGPARLFLVGTLAAGLLYAVVPLVPAPWFLILCTALISFAMPCRFIALNTVFMEQLAHIGDAKAGWMRGNTLIGMLLIGPALGAAITGWLSHVGGYFFTAFTVLITLALAPSALRAHHQPHDRPLKLGFSRLLGQVRLIIEQKALQETSLLEFVLQASIGFFSFFIVPIAINGFHFSQEGAAHIIAGEGALFIGALFFSGHLIPALGLKRVYLGSLSGAIVAMLVLGLARDSLALWSGSLLLGLALGTLQTANLSSFARIGKELGQGHIAGINALVGPTGALLGSLLGGLWGEHFSLQSAFLLLCLPLLSSLTHILLRPRLAITSLN